MIITGRLIDVHSESIYNARIHVVDGNIYSIDKTDDIVEDQYILPGFVDAHVHIESSMLVPTEFARLAVVHGTVATVSDPHEIGNVLGVEGVEYMIDNGRQSPFKFYFGAPSCVPATTYETAGAIIDADDVEYLLSKPEIKYLAEMMNWPGVLYGDEEVYRKIAIAKNLGKPVDGHAPGLRGSNAKKYISAGISTDHECFTKEEALEKLSYGMKIIIREGSAAKNFEALADLLHEHAGMMMLCSDDKHPDSLVEGHINSLVKRALAKGVDLFNVLKAASVNPIVHYNLEVGLLRQGDKADFICIDNIDDFNILSTYIDGALVADHGTSLLSKVDSNVINNFNVETITPDQLKYKNTSETIPVIKVVDGELITNQLNLKPKIIDGLNTSDTTRDILKIVVVNRYHNATPSIAFIKNFGLQHGALASSVAHDSHNVIAVGVDDQDITKAINLIINNRGGIAAVSNDEEQVIPLPVAGLMSTGDGYRIANDYIQIDTMVKRMGSNLISPFMSLSFMALLVIPSLKLSDLGLFDGDKFEFIKRVANNS